MNGTYTRINTYESDEFVAPWQKDEEDATAALTTAPGAARSTTKEQNERN